MSTPVEKKKLQTMIFDEYDFGKMVLCNFGRRFVHPRFGPIKCIRTLRPVRKDEELLVAYGYNHESKGGNGPEAPDWYKSDLEEFQQRQAAHASQ